MKHLVYLHGFLSSPASVKAQETKAYFKSHYPEIDIHIPTLLGDPNATIQIIEEVLASIKVSEGGGIGDNSRPTEPQVGLIGSSLGGFLSTYFATKYHLKAVLINPAVKPFVLLNDYMGRHVNPYTQEEFEITEDTILALRYLDSPISKPMANLDSPKSHSKPYMDSPNQFRVYLQTGDETLDYRLAVEKYGVEACYIEEGGDHSFVNYAAKLPEIAQFLFK
jgi:predicted esterase YcpF (UPF0227 family)